MDTFTEHAYIGAEKSTEARFFHPIEDLGLFENVE